MDVSRDAGFHVVHLEWVWCFRRRVLSFMFTSFSFFLEYMEVMATLNTLFFAFIPFRKGVGFCVVCCHSEYGVEVFIICAHSPCARFQNHNNTLEYSQYPWIIYKCNWAVGWIPLMCSLSLLCSIVVCCSNLDIWVFESCSSVWNISFHSYHFLVCLNDMQETLWHFSVTNFSRLIMFRILFFNQWLVTWLPIPH